MKSHGVRFGQTIIAPAGAGKIVALIVAPRETVVVSGDGYAPGARLDPEDWARAVWDHRRQRWEVAPEPPRAA